MALSAPSQSPAVVVKEVDLTGGVPNVQSTTGAIVGNFRWGPVEERKAVANETELVNTFASPDSSNTIDFHNASYFLRYSSSGQIVRAITSAARNATSTTPATFFDYNAIVSGDTLDSTGFLAEEPSIVYDDSAPFGSATRNAAVRARLASQSIVVKNELSWESQKSTLGDTTHPLLDATIVGLDSDGLGDSSGGNGGQLYYNDSSSIISTTTPSGNFTFVAKYPGELGNSLKVSICPPNATEFNSWDYKGEFDAAPGTSSWMSARGGSRDEIHVAVIDVNGEFSGTSGTVLEKFAFVSAAKNGLTADQANNYAVDVVNENSQYVWWAQWDSDYRAVGAGGTMASSSAGALLDSGEVANADFTFTSGTNSGTLGISEIATGFDLFEDKDQVEVDFLIAPGMSNRTAQTTVVNDLISTAQSTRKDCVVVTSPARSDVVNVTSASDIVDNVVATADTFTNSSYLVMDGNYLKVYDKYNDQYINIPAASSTAGIMAATDINRAPWFSPAGARRGQYLGITSVAYTPTKAQRDTLYKASVNPIANIPGQGVLLFGDKTGLSRPSAFDRINVRRLFLVLERAIARAAENVLFEFNDEFTRAEFVNVIEPLLREVKGRRGITDFRVVADETNNTAEVIDRNEFVASIFIKPARSINYVTLNFVAVRTGADFEEIVGTV